MKYKIIQFYIFDENYFLGDKILQLNINFIQRKLEKCI